jgi:deoxyribonucleoside regulator
MYICTFWQRNAMAYDDQRELLARIASLYYEEEMTQGAIAKQFGLSRVKVYRLLKKAREKRVVQITIHWPLPRDSQRAELLKQRFGLKEALVLRTTPQDGATVLRRLGQLGARYLEQALVDGMTMTVCLGRSTYEVIDAIRPGFRANVHVAQGLGSMHLTMLEFDSAALARQLAQKLGGEVLYLPAPLMADSLEAARMLRRQPDIQRTLMTARQADVALVGIGNLDPATSGFVKAGFITPENLISLRNEGAVGDVGGQIYTLAGTLCPSPYNQRVIGLTLLELKEIPVTIAVATGQDKARAILGGLRTDAITVLCTDDQTAREVLRLDCDCETGPD